MTPDLIQSVSGVVAVVAHPDDESFGLGAVLAELITRGARASLICFTHGEASRRHGTPGDLSLAVGVLPEIDPHHRPSQGGSGDLLESGFLEDLAGTHVEFTPGDLDAG